MQGKIIKGIAGFYYVHVDGVGIFECKARGVFRKENKKPLVGDNAELYALEGGEFLGNITRLLPRKSELIRPAVANVDQALIIFSITKPKPNFNLLDRFLIMLMQQGLPCVICFNKMDLDEQESARAYEEVYRKCGYPVQLFSARTKEGLEELKKILSGKTTTMAGPSGVGKSSVINCLQSQVKMETGAISRKVERGKHTTRHTEMIALGEDTYILDTPGFSSLSLFDLEKEELSYYYPEFREYEKNCRFCGCSHIEEPDCKVKEAVEAGYINPLRYENYFKLYTELRNIKKY